MQPRTFEIHPFVPPGLVAAFYKGNRDGAGAVLSYLGRTLDHGPYSHSELVLSNGLSFSSSLPDGGVRVKHIGYSSIHKWDFLPIPDPTGAIEERVYHHYHLHKDDGYDITGNLRFLTNFIPHSESKQFCSEVNMGALGYPESWRYGPCGMMVTLAHDFKTNLLRGPARTFV